MEKLHFAFLGTPHLARETLEILHISGYTPTVIITSPDAQSGRGLHLHSSPVKLWAQEHGIPCLTPEKLTPQFIEEFKQYAIDISIVVAYGKIIPEALIQIPTKGTINIHYSLLPKYRGASPLEQALLNGDTITGVTIQQMAFKLDTGAILSQTEVQIPYDETKESLKTKLTQLGADMLIDLLPKLNSGTIRAVEQSEKNASYCKKIKKEDAEINLQGDPKENYNTYRAFFGWPGTYFFETRNNKKIRIKIIKARYENNSFIIERVIPEGRKEIAYTDFLSSNTLK